MRTLTQHKVRVFYILFYPKTKRGAIGMIAPRKKGAGIDQFSQIEMIKYRRRERA